MQVLLSAGVCRNGGDDRLGRSCRANQVSHVHRVLLHHGDRHLSGRGTLDLGWRLAGDEDGTSSISPARRASIRLAAGRHWPGDLILGPRIGKYGPDGKSERDSRPQLDGGHDRLLRAVVWLVWIQSRQHDGRRFQRHWPTSPSPRTRLPLPHAHRDADLLAAAGQARPRHDDQWLPGGTRGDHGRRVRL